MQLTSFTIFFLFKSNVRGGYLVADAAGIGGNLGI